VVLPFIGKANATLNELKALIKNVASELQVCLDKDGLQGALCVLDVVSKRKQETEKIVQDIKAEVQQAKEILKKIVSDVKETAKSIAESAKQSAQDIKEEVEQCVREKLES
jgi:methyl-accepting chemotaxis protein